MTQDNKAYMQQYAQENRKRLSAYKLAWKKNRLENPEYRERQNELQRIRRASNPSQEQAQKSRIRSAVWKENNKGKVVANTTARKKHVRIRTPKWLDKSDKFEMECVYMYCAALRKIGLKYEVDHEIPLLGANVSGLHVPSNLRVVHEDVNRAKSNRYEVE